MLMRKLSLFFLLLLFILGSDAQQKYRCVFSETILAVIPDSLFRYLALKNNFSEKKIEEILERQKTNYDSIYYLKIVRAGKDQTVINRDRSSFRGNLAIDIVDSFLYKNDELYYKDSASSRFSDKPLEYPKKVFRGTGKKLSILNYECDEYISTDSTCYIWITDELPAYINPGARTNNVKGAVLGFKLRRMETMTRTMLVKLEKVL